MTMTLEVVELTSSLEAASQARGAVRAALETAGQETIDHACLIVDELVAGALLAVGAPVRLVLERHADHLVVEVLDAGISAVAVDDRIGMAQVLLETWAVAWGALEQSSGTSVWFTIAT
jgi:hypothetical protein